MSAKPNKDRKVINVLAANLLRMKDFSGKTAEAQQYAEAVIKTLREKAEDSDDFKDQAMGIIANVKHLEGEISRDGVAPGDLAQMNIPEIISQRQRRRLALASRKRGREQTNVDRTSMLCTKCGLVRRDRLNINELALDSEENGTQFDYNFDNTCTCSHSSDESEDEEELGDLSERRSKSDAHPGEPDDSSLLK